MKSEVKSLLILMVCTVLAFGVAQTSAQEAEPTPLFGGARPEAEVLETTSLFSQPRYPGGNEPLVLAEVQAGERVIVLDVDDTTRSWFRVLWPGNDEESPIFGWVRVDYVDYSTRRANPYAAPPGCTRPLGVTHSLEDLWDSTVNGKVAVVIDLYRDTRQGDYPSSTFLLTRNGQELHDRERLFRSAGYFLMNGVVISADVREGNVVGFFIDSSSDEPLNFFGLLYYVPQGCDFGE